MNSLLLMKISMMVVDTSSGTFSLKNWFLLFNTLLLTRYFQSVYKKSASESHTSASSYRWGKLVL